VCYDAVLCPVCIRSGLEPILQEITIKAEIDGERVVGGLLGFRCLDLGHVFFVRRADVEAEATLVELWSLALQAGNADSRL
jgi:hypothetical protein